LCQAPERDIDPPHPINEGGLEGYMSLSVATRKLLLMTALVVAVVAAVTLAGPGATADRKVRRAVAPVKDINGKLVATVTFTVQESGMIHVSVWGEKLPPGFHGFHIHAVGVCDRATKFMSAGGHLASSGQTHGGHDGDLPVLLVNGNGTARERVNTDRFGLKQLLDVDGSAVVIHELPDNYANIPDRYGTPDTTTLATGDSGGRIGCGVVDRG
jgi:Cu-Zn family superoxide dismutase